MSCSLIDRRGLLPPHHHFPPASSSSSSSDAELPSFPAKNDAHMVGWSSRWSSRPPHGPLAPPPPPPLLLLLCSCRCCRCRTRIQLLRQPREHKLMRLRWTKCGVVCEWGDAMCRAAKLWIKAHTGGNDGGCLIQPVICCCCVSVVSARGQNVFQSSGDTFRHR